MWGRRSSIVAADVGSATVKMAQVDGSGGKVVLRHGAVSAIDGKGPVSLLKQLLADAKINSRQVAFAVASPEVVIRSFEFPKMAQEELEKAIRLEAERASLSGEPIEEMVVDWHILSSNGTTRGILAMVPRKAILPRLNLAQEAGLSPILVDVEGLALWNCYWELSGRKESAAKTVLLLNIGAGTTNLVIAQGPDQIILIRDFPLGARLFQAGPGDDWLAEVRDSLSYAHAECGLKAIEAAYVTGGGSAERKITEPLSAMLAKPVVVWNPLSHLSCEPKQVSIPESSGPLLAVAIGLALRQIP